MKFIFWKQTSILLIWKLLECLVYGLEFNRVMVNQGLYLINLVRIGAPTPNHETLLHGTWYMDQGNDSGYG